MVSHAESHTSLVAELHALRDCVAKQQQELAALRIQRDLALVLNTSKTLDEALTYVLDAVLLLDEIDCGGVYLADVPNGTFDMIVHKGLSPQFVDVVRHLSIDSPQIQLILQNKTTAIYHYYTDLFPNLSPIQLREGIQAIAGLPVYDQDQLIAVLNVGSHSYHDIPVVQRATLEAIATQIGRTIVRLEQESEHRRVAEAYRSLVEYSLQALVIFQDNHIIFANPMFAQITGYVLEELLDGGTEEIYQAIYPEDRQRVWTNIQARQAGKTAPAHYTFRLIRKDGSVRWLEVSAVSITYRGKPAIQGAFIDITDQKQTQEALHQSQALLEGVLEYSPVAIYIKDIDGQFLLVNQRTTEILQMERTQIIGKTVQDLLSPSFAAKWRKNVQFIQTTGNMLAQEETFPQQDGLHTYLSIAFPLKDSHGTITMIGGISMDITERVRAEEANRSLVEHSLQGLAIYQQGKLRFVNPRMESMTGYSQETLLALSLQDMEQLVHPDYHAPIRHSLRHMAKHPSASVHVEYPIIRKDGKIRWIETYAVQIDYRGSPAIQVACIDLTERRLAEESLRESEERYRMLVETSPSAILLTSLDGTIRFCNQQAATLFGYATTQDLTGHSSTDLIAFDASDSGSLEHIQRIIETGSLRNIEYTLHRQGGSRFPAEVNSSVFTDQQGKPSGLIVVVQDISERKQLQAQLIENERFAASGRLAASVAHEINTPLQSLQNSLSLIRKMQDRQKRDSFLLLAQDEIERVGRIVHQLLDLYRPTTKTHGALDVNNLLERILLLFGKQFKDHGIAVHRHFHQQLPVVYGRADELSQVFINLCVNAAEAMEHGGRLYVQTHQLPDKVSVTLRDTGCGIAPDLLEKIFDPFITNKEYGTGLGLAICKQIIDHHQGSITVSSTPGEGSVFDVTLPI